MAGSWAMWGRAAESVTVILRQKAKECSIYTPKEMHIKLVGSLLKLMQNAITMKQDQRKWNLVSKIANIELPQKAAN